MIYAGYCQKLKYVWLSNSELNLTCSGKSTKQPGLLATTALGVRIDYTETDNGN